MQITSGLQQASFRSILTLAEAAVRNLFVASYDLIHFQEAIRVERKEMSASLFGDQISRPQKNIHHAFSI